MVPVELSILLVEGLPVLLSILLILLKVRSLYVVIEYDPLLKFPQVMELDVLRVGSILPEILEILDSGWTRILYNGSEAYISSDFVIVVNE